MEDEKAGSPLRKATTDDLTWLTGLAMHALILKYVNVPEAGQAIVSDQETEDIALGAISIATETLATLHTVEQKAAVPSTGTDAPGS